MSEQRETAIVGLQISIRKSGDVTTLDLQGRSTIHGESELLNNRLRKLISNGVSRALLNLADLFGSIYSIIAPDEKSVSASRVRTMDKHWAPVFEVKKDPPAYLQRLSPLRILADRGPGIGDRYVYLWP